MTYLHRCWSLLFLLNLLFRTALPIKCMTCQTFSGELQCDSIGSRQTCTESLSSKEFNYLKELSSELTEPVRNTGYQCMELQLNPSSKLVKGCIYANLDVCDRFPKATSCLLCKEDDCNSKQFKDGGLVLRGSTTLLVVMIVLAGIIQMWHN